MPCLNDSEPGMLVIWQMALRELKGWVARGVHLKRKSEAELFLIGARHYQQLDALPPLPGFLA